MDSRVIVIAVLLVFMFQGTADAADNSTVDVLVIHSIEGTRVVNEAAHRVLQEYPDRNITIRVRSSPQIVNSTPEEVEALINSSDVIICNYLGTEDYTRMLRVITAKPEILNGKFFAVFDGASGLELVKMSRINDELVFNGVPDTVVSTVSRALRVLQPLPLLEAYVNQYPQIALWAQGEGYYCYRNVPSYRNQILWAADVWARGRNITLNVTYDPPRAVPRELLYRDGKLYENLTDYLRDYPLDPAKPTIGFIESESNMLGGGTAHIDSLIEKLRNRYNIISAVARYGENTYSAMVRFFTTAPDLASFEANTTLYTPRIQALVSFSTYLLGGSASEKVKALLRFLNVPVLRGVIVNTRTVDDWLLSSDGVTPWSQDDIMGQAGFPETQGLIEPIIIAAAEFQSDRVTGAYTYSYSPIPERVEKLAARLTNWVNLSLTPAGDKRIAIIYYNYPPGKSEIGASYLNVPESIHEILLNLNKEGYRVGNITGAAELVTLMVERGINIANWAPGELERLANTTGVILWDAEEYLRWFQGLNPIARRYVTEGPTAYMEELLKMGLQRNVKAETLMKALNSWYAEMKDNIKSSDKASEGLQLLEVMYTALSGIIGGNSSLWSTFQAARNSFMLLGIPGLCGWGEPPGNVMTVTRNGRKYIVIPGILEGNVFIGPQPQRGWEANPEMLYNVGVLPPHHQYLAYYAWINTVFNASAMIHMGTMGSYEWLPGKEVMLAGFDFPDIVVDETPSIYIYRVDNAADGLAAKRRGLAVIIDHLTPAMKSTGLYGELLTLKELISNYKKADEQLKNQYLAEIRNTSLKLNLEDELGISIQNSTPDELITTISGYLMRIESTLIPVGLHTFGREWSSDAIAYMVSSMISTGDSSIYRLLAAEYGWIYEELTLDQRAVIENRTLTMVRALVDGSGPENLTDSPDILSKLQAATEYIALIRRSTAGEMSSLLNALRGGYVEPGPGREPLMNPSGLPTGRNFYTIDPSTVPTQAAYSVGAEIVRKVLATYTEPPEKLAVVIWGVDTARDDGAMVSFVLNLLGVKPVWSSSGTVTGVKLIPLSELGRPRIDAVVTVSGLFRDVYGQVAVTMDRAFRLALAASYTTILEGYPQVSEALEAAVKPLRTLKLFTAGSDPLEMNRVAVHWLELVQKYLGAGMNASDAGNLAIYRIFAPPLGSYGTGVKEAGEMSWTYNSTDELADLFMSRMGTSYSETGWGVKNVDLLADLLRGVSAVYQGRSTYLVGVTENDDMADYLGGLSLAIRKLTGSTPAVNIITVATGTPEILSLQQTIAIDMRTRYLNPEYVRGLMSEGYAGANRLSSAVRSLWLWQVTSPSGVPSWAWDELADTYIRDVNGLGVREWLSGKNSYALISITGTMLQAAHEGHWKADDATLRLLASTWAQAMAENGVACCDCSCGNIAMMEWAMQYLNPDLLARVKEKLYVATGSSAFAPAGGSTPDIPSTPNQGDSGGGSTSAGRNPSPGRGAGISNDAGTSVSEVKSAQESPAAGAGKAYEVSRASSSQGSSTGMPIYAIIGVIALVALAGVGYFMGGGRNRI
ncbi:cobaltochelatase subunit CobN [Methanothermobacter sp.]|uniref:cobaltochelatase subunit CobN n=1 Tax=Methanothermobacter sp. TaxID=1884223 RepID=UPI00261736D7|nr:cobaltochelatase subunit CobN [Methanothermobacter sp.]MDI9617662.1 cobaltochelatase subunit CobN [Methanothermobacter sp.]